MNQYNILGDLNLNVGDVVSCADWPNLLYDIVPADQKMVEGSGGRFMVGDLVAVERKGKNWCQSVKNSAAYRWKVVSRAPKTPVREVQTVRKEIVPGVYGRLSVGVYEGEVNLGFTDPGSFYPTVVLTIEELEEVIKNMTSILEVMKENQK